MKTILSILLLAFAFSAQAKTAEINCQSKVYSCVNDRGGLHCEWLLVNGEPVVSLMLAQDDHADIWRGTLVRDFDGHRLILKLRYEEQLSEDGQIHKTLRSDAELWTPQVSAETSGSSRIDIGLHNINYGRGFFCRSIKITN